MYSWNQETSWRWLLAYGADRDATDKDSRERFWLFPFIFRGQDADGSKYLAVFPFGGTLHHFIGRDRILFVLWPIYSHTRVHDLEAHHIVWPFISWTRGESEHGFRAFPFYGEIVNEGRLSKRFVLWPFWTSVRYDYPTEKGKAFVLFPIFGRVHTTRQDGWMVLPPFFRWSKSPELTQGNLPWPFIQYSRGQVDKFYLWPLMGRRTSGHTHKSFFLWPIVRHEVLKRAEGEHRRVHVLPFLYADSTRVTTNRPAVERPAAERDTQLVTGDATNGIAWETPGTVTSRYFKLWPLVEYRREKDVTAWRALALWPVKQSGPIERDWSPLWTLYARHSTASSWDTELLWGLWRQRRGADGSTHTGLFPVITRDRAGKAAGPHGWKLFGGLVGYEREGLKKRTRLLYFLTFTSRKSDTSSSPEEASVRETDAIQP